MYRCIIHQEHNNCVFILVVVHCKNKIVKITNTFVSTVARNSRNCNLISHAGCYDCMMTYNVHTLITLPIIIQ